METQQPECIDLEQSFASDISTACLLHLHLLAHALNMQPHHVPGFVALLMLSILACKHAANLPESLATLPDRQGSGGHGYW